MVRATTTNRTILLSAMLSIACRTDGETQVRPEPAPATPEPEPDPEPEPEPAPPLVPTKSWPFHE